MSLADDLADKLAARLIVHIQKTGDEEMINIIAKSIGDSSQTLQEAFITSVRVQRAAIRAEEMLDKRIEEKAAEALAPAEPDEEPEGDADETADDAEADIEATDDVEEAEAEDSPAPEDEEPTTATKPSGVSVRRPASRKSDKAAEKKAKASKPPEPEPEPEPEPKPQPKGPWDLG